MMTKAIPLTCDIWDTDFYSDNWEPEFLTVFISWQLRMTLDSIRNSCDVYELHSFIKPWVLLFLLLLAWVGFFFFSNVEFCEFLFIIPRSSLNQWYGQHTVWLFVCLFGEAWTSNVFRTINLSRYKSNSSQFPASKSLSIYTKELPLQIPHNIHMSTALWEKLPEGLSENFPEKS